MKLKVFFLLLHSNELSIGGCGGGSRSGTIWQGEPRAWWGRAKKRGGPERSENVWFLGRCDAGDVIDGEECIISIMRGSGGYLNSLRPGVGVHVEDRKGWITGCEKWFELQEIDMRVSQHFG